MLFDPKKTNKRRALKTQGGLCCFGQITVILIYLPDSSLLMVVCPKQKNHSVDRVVYENLKQN